MSALTFNPVTLNPGGHAELDSRLAVLRGRPRLMRALPRQHMPLSSWMNRGLRAFSAALQSFQLVVRYFGFPRDSCRQFARAHARPVHGPIWQKNPHEYFRRSPIKSFATIQFEQLRSFNKRKKNMKPPL